MQTSGKEHCPDCPISAGENHGLDSASVLEGTDAARIEKVPNAQRHRHIMGTRQARTSPFYLLKP